jgi:hypothetical protein
VDWDRFEFDPLARHLRDSLDGYEAERMIRAFRKVVLVAQHEPGLLPHLLAATVCLLAREEASSPRTVLEAYFRRSVSDEKWREQYLPLFE